MVEISALTINETDSVIYTVNDEKGKIYSLNDCEITGEYSFGKNGDYEGIELVGDQLFVLKSNGKLIQYNLKLKSKVREIKNPLSQSNDTEGLGYDQATNCLLIACKASPNIKKKGKLKKTKAVYTYNIVEDSFSDKPFLTISDANIQAYFDKAVSYTHLTLPTKA